MTDWVGRILKYAPPSILIWSLRKNAYIIMYNICNRRDDGGLGKYNSSRVSPQSSFSNVKISYFFLYSASRHCPRMSGCNEGDSGTFSKANQLAGKRTRQRKQLSWRHGKCKIIWIQTYVGPVTFDYLGGFRHFAFLRHGIKLDLFNCTLELHFWRCFLWADSRSGNFESRKVSLVS